MALHNFTSIFRFYPVSYTHLPTSTFTPKGLAFDNGKDYTDLTEGMGYEYNEEQAKELWEKAKEEVGFDTVEMELLTYDHDTGKRTGEYIQSELSLSLIHI